MDQETHDFDMHTRMAYHAMVRIGSERRGGEPCLSSTLYLVTRWARQHFGRHAPCWATVRLHPEIMLRAIPELIRSGRFDPISIGLVPTLHGRYGEEVVRAAIQTAVDAYV